MILKTSALKFARNDKLILENWLNILTLGQPSYQNTREGILLQTLTLYIFNLFDMTEAKVKTLNKQLPEPERDWIDAIPEIFGRKWKEEGLRKGLEEGREQGREQAAHAFTVKMIPKFPELTDADIAELVDVTDKFVQRVRREVTEKQ